MENGPAWINLLWALFGLGLLVTLLMFAHSVFILIKNRKNPTHQSKFWPILLFLSLSMVPMAGLVTGWVYLFGEIITPMRNRNNQDVDMQQTEIRQEDDQGDKPPSLTT